MLKVIVLAFGASQTSLVGWILKVQTRKRLDETPFTAFPENIMERDSKRSKFTAPPLTQTEVLEDSLCKVLCIILRILDIGVVRPHL